MSTIQARGTRARRSDPRVARTRTKVLAAAAAILALDGYSGLTMERVAMESGVAKTTIYRRWPTKAALCMALYLDLADRELDVPDTGNVAKDLRRIADAVVQLQTRTVAGPAFVGLLTEAQVAPETRIDYAAFAERRRAVTRVVLKRGIARGELRPDTNVDLLIDALGGAVTFRLLQGHAPLDTKFTKALVDLLLRGCRATETR